MTDGTGAGTHRLDRLLNPRSIAIVGASERNHYSNLAMRALRGLGFDGPLQLVNQRGAPAYGMESVTKCSALAEPVDAAYLCVPVAGLIDTVRDAIDAGIRNLVIVTSGFAELGGEGAAREAELKAMCAASDTRVIGPNSLGYRNNLGRVALGSIPFVEQPTRPTIALISASGSVASSVINYGIRQGTGFTHVIATGNEMNVSTADIIDYLIGIPEVRAIALFIEQVRDPATFAAAAERARLAGKPIVALKIGSAETTAAVAAAHTGAAVGDDKVFDAVCHRLAIVRVRTIEALVVTAATLAATGPIARPGVGLVSISGGICEIASDYGEAAGVSIPQFAEPTRAALAAVLSDLGQMHNPLDMTGAAVRDEDLWIKVPQILARDPAIGITLINWDVPSVAEPSMPNTLALIGRALAETTAPALLIANSENAVNEHGRAYLDQHGQLFSLPGIGKGMEAVGKLAWWSERVGRPPLPAAAPAAPAGAAHPVDERQTLDHLATHGVPVIPTRIVRTADEAVAAAQAIGEPVVLKILSADIAHKSEVGGVALNLAGDAAVAQAFDTMMATVRERAPAAAIEGVIVAPMRSGGIELLVGIARDPQWGLVCAVGLGGFWVDALGDTALCLLPAGRDDIVAAFRSLRGVRMLEGYRGAAPVDLDAVAEVVVRIGAAAAALGDDLAALEVNPLLVSGDRIEALDALAVWSTQ
ncbi:acetate--CoA ligase family protein [Sphingomonas solaris]|uniref:Acetate--CoA ligase family protein n=1 Tax=Alterirhizorhabdus solaris TaxID=2529389 RepID=A0A558RBH8_9SPHN|nr:acetate--CoA ligase family protein [Sphingomonas solaris]TVV76759.1 acetate--CoA ligase family protein [Sphingomonas solaris]